MFAKFREKFQQSMYICQSPKPISAREEWVDEGLRVVGNNLELKNVKYWRESMDKAMHAHTYIVDYKWKMRRMLEGSGLQLFPPNQIFNSIIIIKYTY